MTQQIHKELARRKPRLVDTERFLLGHLSEPKATTVFDGPAKTLSPAQFRRRAMARGLALDRRTRILYSNAAIGINGDWSEPPRAAMAALRTLADQRAFTADQAQRVPVPSWALLHAWYCAGWIVVD
jgi:50S ribosomal protein L16 3-hydroxylase